jgi:hypothetical protein
MSSNAFSPTGNTVVFTANVAAPTAVQALSSSLGGGQYRVVNAGTSDVYIGSGLTAAAANASAVIIGTSNAVTFLLLGRTVEVLSLAPNLFFTGITAAGGSSVLITPGDGS